MSFKVLKNESAAALLQNEPLLVRIETEKVLFKKKYYTQSDLTLQKAGKQDSCECFR